MRMCLYVLISSTQSHLKPAGAPLRMPAASESAHDQVSAHAVRTNTLVQRRGWSSRACRGTCTCRRSRPHSCTRRPPLAPPARFFSSLESRARALSSPPGAAPPPSSPVLSAGTALLAPLLLCTFISFQMSSPIPSHSHCLSSSNAHTFLVSRRFRLCVACSPSRSPFRLSDPLRSCPKSGLIVRAVVNHSGFEHHQVLAWVRCARTHST